MEITAFALNTNDAAEYIGVSSSLLRKLRDNNEGPSYSKVGSRVVYPVVCVKFCKLDLRMWWPRSETGGREWAKVSLVGGRRSLGHAANCISCSFLRSRKRFISR